MSRDLAVDVGAEGVEVAEDGREVHLAVRAELERGERGGRALPLAGLRLGELGARPEADARHRVRADLLQLDRLAADVDILRAAHRLVGELDERLDLARRERLAALDVGLEEFHDRLAHPRAVVVDARLEEGVRRGPVGVRAVACVAARSLERLALGVDELVRALSGNGTECIDVERHI